MFSVHPYQLAPAGPSNFLYVVFVRIGELQLYIANQVEAATSRNKMEKDTGSASSSAATVDLFCLCPFQNISISGPFPEWISAHNKKFQRSDDSLTSNM